MTYNFCYFLGNKAFVIDFLETVLLCCVCILRPTGKELSGENKHPPPESWLAYYPDLSSVLLLSVNKIVITFYAANKIHCRVSKFVKWIHQTIEENKDDYPRRK